MNPFSKSPWIVPAAYGALVCSLIVHARTSSAPDVKKQIRSSSLNPCLMIFSIWGCGSSGARLLAS